MEKINITWNNVKDICYDFKDKLKAYNPDILIGIARGGLIPLVIISEMLDNRNIDIIQTKLYEKDKKQGEIKLSLKPQINLEGKKLLVINDVADTGETLLYITNLLKKQNPKEIKTFTLHYKTKSKIKPDYYGKILNKWIIYPWDHL